MGGSRQLLLNEDRHEELRLLSEERSDLADLVHTLSSTLASLKGKGASSIPHADEQISNEVLHLSQLYMYQHKRAQELKAENRDLRAAVDVYVRGSLQFARSASTLNALPSLTLTADSRTDRSVTKAHPAPRGTSTRTEPSLPTTTSGARSRA